MAQPLSEVQVAMITALRADAGVQTALKGSAPDWNIAEYVTTGHPFPYLAVGEQTTGRPGTLLTMGIKATDLIVALHIFSLYTGFAEAQAIVSAVDSVLNEKGLTLANGYINPFLLIDGITQIREPDGRTFHIALRYKLMTQGG